ncbi:MAG: ion channel [Weeksellaceae bacterium]
MINNIKKFLHRYKYQFLLIALIVHLYIGIFLANSSVYLEVIWPMNMLFLGLASAGVYIEKSQFKTRIQNLLWIVAFLLPLSIPIIGATPNYLIIISIFYCIFFGIIFYEIISFLIKPSYINEDIIFASACGYFLIIEIMVFLLQSVYYYDPSVLSNMHSDSVVGNFMDIVYFSSISLTTMGYGDITPSSHVTRLIMSLFGVIGQFYAVVLVGILISKFASVEERNRREDREI